MKEQHMIAYGDYCPSQCKYQHVFIMVVPHHLLEEPLELLAPLRYLYLYLLLKLLLMQCRHVNDVTSSIEPGYRIKRLLALKKSFHCEEVLWALWYRQRCQYQSCYAASEANQEDWVDIFINNAKVHWHHEGWQYLKGQEEGRKCYLRMVGQEFVQVVVACTDRDNGA